jgi:hypothetical protein
MAALWWRGRSSYDDVMWAGGMGEYEVSSHRGVVRWLRIDHRAQPRGPAWASGGGDPRLVPRHHERLSEAASASRGRLGWSSERGTTPGGATISNYPFVKVTVPHAWLVAAAMVLPASWAAGWVRGMLKRRSRRRRGRCIACGYDLRGIEGAKCPECGMDP